MRLLMISVLLVTLTYSNAQTTQTAESIKKENQKLKAQIKALQYDTAELNNKVRFCDGLAKSKELDLKGLTNDIKVAILSCKGDRTNQTVTIEFAISHEIVNQSICVATENRWAKAFDEIGNQFPVKGSELGVSDKDFNAWGRCNKIPTSVPVRGSITFKNVLPSTKLLKLVSVAFKHRTYDSENAYQMSSMEIQNLAVNW